MLWGNNDGNSEILMKSGFAAGQEVEEIILEVSKKHTNFHNKIKVTNIKYRLWKK